MIDLYTWTTPNGRKISIALEELGLPYTAHAVDIGKDEQFKPEFLKISPNNRIPAIVDRDNGMSLMESGAILIYLGDKTGKLLPKSGEKRYRVIEWLMWQMGGPGPMLGQVHHFVKYNKGKAPYAEERYLKEAHRLYGVLNRRLEGREFVADEYSVADIAIWPWISRFEWQTIDLESVSQREALVPDDREAPGGGARLCGPEEGQRHPDAGVKLNSVRKPDAALEKFSLRLDRRRRHLPGAADRRRRALDARHPDRAAGEGIPLVAGDDRARDLDQPHPLRLASGRSPPPSWSGSASAARSRCALALIGTGVALDVADARILAAHSAVGLSGRAASARASSRTCWRRPWRRAGSRRGAVS